MFYLPSLVVVQDFLVLHCCEGFDQLYFFGSKLYLSREQKVSSGVFSSRRRDDG